MVNYIPTYTLHKDAPEGNMVIGACPYPCLPHPSPMRTNRHLYNIALPVTVTPLLLSPCLPTVPICGSVRKNDPTESLLRGLECHPCLKMTYIG